LPPPAISGFVSQISLVGHIVLISLVDFVGPSKLIVRCSYSKISLLSLASSAQYFVRENGNEESRKMATYHCLLLVDCCFDAGALWELVAVVDVKSYIGYLAMGQSKAGMKGTCPLYTDPNQVYTFSPNC
jgi:hypothetical protein